MEAERASTDSMTEGIFYVGCKRGRAPALGQAWYRWIGGCGTTIVLRLAQLPRRTQGLLIAAKGQECPHAAVVAPIPLARQLGASRVASLLVLCVINITQDNSH